MAAIKELSSSKPQVMEQLKREGDREQKERGRKGAGNKEKEGQTEGKVEQPNRKRKRPSGCTVCVPHVAAATV